MTEIEAKQFLRESADSAGAGRWDESIALARRAIECCPDFGEGYDRLGQSLRASGQLREAIDAYRAGIDAQPGCVANYCHLAEALIQNGQVLEAMAAGKQALRLDGNSADAWYILGIAHVVQNDLEEAVRSFKKVTELRPGFVEAFNNLGNALKLTGETAKAIDAYRAGLTRDPRGSIVHSNLIFLMLFLEQYDAEAILAEMMRWNAFHAEPFYKSILPHENDRTPDRRLRVGYVSSDLCHHILLRNILPLFREHDHGQFETFCYSNVARPDQFTNRCKGLMDHWRNIRGLDDDRAARMIREDRIDILVDLAGHMGETRLMIFARKPAPVQVTFGGYPGGTGLTTMDFRLSDPYLDPPGMNESHYVERIVRLPHSWWCYLMDEMDVTSPIRPTPSASRDGVVFGCLSSSIKISDHSLNVWKRLLAQMPESRLVLLEPPRAQRDKILRALGEGRERIRFVASRPRAAYLELYHEIDIFLDSLPYNGHTTALDALVMGVPVVTRPGATAVGRAGVSILTNLGLTELIGKDDEAYISIAKRLAGDIPRLNDLRMGMRARMQASPLMDARRFARDIEAAYRQMWSEWCARVT
ncbi:MAG: tetratricopeptide repeat protein [Tepidisphaeraceae bacterium]